MRLRPLLRIFVNVRNTLASDMARECYIFLFFVVVSAGFWMIKMLQETYEVELPVSLVLADVPDNVVITRQLPDTVYVKVRDRGTVILGLKMQLRGQPLQVSFREFSTRQSVGTVTIDNLSKRLSAHIAAATTLQAVRPSTTFFSYNRGVARRVPVRLSSGIDTHPQYKLESVALRPDSVVVYASQRQLDSLSHVGIELTGCSGLRCDTSITVHLPSGGSVKYVPDTISVSIAVDMYTEKKVRVPITGTGFPADCRLRTFPATVELTFRVGTRDYNSINAENFRLMAPYAELTALPEGSRWRVHISSMPQGTSSPRFTPAEVEYLIEQSAVDE